METWTVADWLTNYAISVLVGQLLSSIVMSRSATTPTTKDLVHTAMGNLVWPFILVVFVLVTLSHLEMYLFRRTPDKPNLGPRKNSPVDAATKDCMDTYRSTLEACVDALGEYADGDKGARAVNTLAMVESAWRAFNARWGNK